MFPVLPRFDRAAPPRPGPDRPPDQPGHLNHGSWAGRGKVTPRTAPVGASTPRSGNRSPRRGQVRIAADHRRPRKLRAGGSTRTSSRSGSTSWARPWQKKRRRATTRPGMGQWQTAAGPRAAGFVHL